MPYRILTLFVCIVLLLSSSVHAEDNTHLTVAWLDNNNNIMVWHTGDAAPHSIALNLVAGSAQQILLSPDAQYVIINVNTPGSLWLAASTDTPFINIVPNQVLPTPDNDPKFENIINL